MQKLKLFIHCILLATTPTLLAYPQTHVKLQVTNYGYQQETEEWVPPTTYDGIMQMLEDLESGELERRYSPLQLERVNNYLATLAKEGILPDEIEEEATLEEDTYDLIYGEDSAFELARYLENSSEYMIIPAVFNGYSGYNMAQCGKISHAWKKTKKFVKKHKKAIIIGAVVVVAVTVVAVAVVVASSASAAAAAAGAAGAAAGAGAGSLDDSSSESKEEPPSTPIETPPPIDAKEVPTLKAAIGEHVSSFKEFLVEDKAAQQATSPNGWDEISLSEKAREVGANLAHRAFDEITDLVKVVPQLCEEVKEIGAKFLPESLTRPNSEETGSAIENYENLIARGHQVIDKVFSTDQAELFTAEAKANDPLNHFAVGVIPVPGVFSSGKFNVKELTDAGKVIDRGGFTKAGRGLTKHGYREGSVFPKPLGNPAQVNEQGQKMLESILNHPEKKVVYKNTSSFGEVMDIHAPGIGGARFNSSGEMIGFLEP